MTESGEGKRLSSPDLSYVPLQGTGADVEERASSEESQTRNNNNRPTGAERDTLIQPQDRTGHPTVLRSNRTLNGVGPREGEELAPLNKRDAATDDLHNGDVGIPAALTGPASEFEPPDGGVRAWSIMVASFLINGILFGIINSYSVVYTELQTKLSQGNETDASSKACKLYKSIIIRIFIFIFMLTIWYVSAPQSKAVVAGIPTRTYICANIYPWLLSDRPRFFVVTTYLLSHVFSCRLYNIGTCMYFTKLHTN